MKRQPRRPPQPRGSRSFRVCFTLSRDASLRRSDPDADWIRWMVTGPGSIYRMSSVSVVRVAE